ncbi:alpha/beta hydrolase, partial [Pelagibacterales bacterium SAG-MED47]|nr:alpha/beta hydrolase [Pelagibacterales bacterium SAG-MED47]
MSETAIDCSYSIEGSGPAIFLTHGVGAAEDAWRIITPKLKKKFTIITY